MPRRSRHSPLAVLINGRAVGKLEKEASGAIRFDYAAEWLDWPHRFPISLSLPLRKAAWRGDAVTAVLDNLLPDNLDVRRIVAERTGAAGVDAYSLLEQIGRDCVGALQFLPLGATASPSQTVEGEPLDDGEIEQILANLGRAPLGIETDQAFRLSVAGAQEKTALLRHDGRWKRPVGATPTTHILKPQIGEIPTASGVIDLSDSVENEHYCLKLMEAFGLAVATTQIVDFGKRRVLVVERFDRRWRDADHLIRLPQEDFCQALSAPSSRKYQNQGGPSPQQILARLGESDDPHTDRLAFFKSLIIFWLIGATDGHAKNFSLFLRPGGRFQMTPLYDVLSAQPAFDAKRIPHKSYTLAMSAGLQPHYKILDVMGRHFIEMAEAADLGPTLVRQALTELLELADSAADTALAQMPADFHEPIHASIRGAISARLPRLATALDTI